ncbi:cyclodeaminase/cyclohydrolase family protein [bacterium]|nr:cyclodeaminase/cyclohydrolase family protein [bacterium]
MLIDRKVKDYLAETASKAPAPGGGSAAALSGALGVALSEMVINLTVGKKKYVDVSAELAALLPQLMAIRHQLEAAIDKDTEAFNLVMHAFGLPKETDEDKAARRNAIREATLKATEVPLGVMQAALKAMQLTLTVAEKGNKNSISDAGVAALLLATAIDGAAYNVRINLPGLPEGTPFRQEAEASLESVETVKEKLAVSIASTVSANL